MQFGKSCIAYCTCSNKNNNSDSVYYVSYQPWSLHEQRVKKQPTKGKDISFVQVTDSHCATCAISLKHCLTFGSVLFSFTPHWHSTDYDHDRHWRIDQGWICWQGHVVVVVVIARISHLPHTLLWSHCYWFTEYCFILMLVISGTCSWLCISLLWWS